MRQNKKNKGFTLVELLIVVAIIGILAAVLTPQFLNARKVAVDKAAEAYAHNVYTAVMADLAYDGTWAGDTTADVDCTRGYTGKEFSVAEPVGAFTFKGTGTAGCAISVDADNDVTVTVKYDGGSKDTAELPRD